MRLVGGLLLLLSTAAAAQWPGDQKIPPVKYPDLPTHAASLTAFVPQGWKLQTKASGDLNDDGLPDAALVLRMDSPRNRIFPSFDPKHRYDTNPHMLMVVLAAKGGGYDLAVANHQLIPRRENPNMDDPFDGIAIKNRVLTVSLTSHYEAGGFRDGDAAFHLRWQDGAVKLIGYDSNWIYKGPGDTETVSIDYLTHRARVVKGSLESDAAPARTVLIPAAPLKPLDAVGDGLMFEPDLPDTDTP